MYITLKIAKTHLNTDDDDYILGLIQVAEDAVAKNENIALGDLLHNGMLPHSVIHSI